MPLLSLNAVSPTLIGAGPAFIAPDAQVIGAVTLGEDSSVWFGAVLRGDNEPIVVGARTNIQEHSVLHTDMGFPLTLGAGCTIGHRAVVHGCTVGDNALIGMGAIILNGATIGNNCIVGAGALVTEGKTFEDGSLIVGAPARAIRQLDEDGIAALRASAAHYADNARRFAQGLGPAG